MLIVQSIERTDIDRVCRLPIRRDPSIKRSICRNCDSILIPGVTSSVRVLRESFDAA